jgi:O-antigen/teichoic acid export membrane protein
MLKHFFNYFIYSAGAGLISFISILYLSHNLQPESIANIGLFQAISFFLIPLSTFASTALVGITKETRNSEQYDLFKSGYFTFILFNSSIILSCACIFWLVFESDLIVYSAIYSIINSISAIHMIENILDQRSKIWGAMSLFTSIAALLLTVFFIEAIDFEWRARIFALIIAECVAFFIRIKFLGFRIHFSLNGLNKLQIFENYKFGLPVMITVVGTWLFSSFDRIFIAKYFSLHEVGLYTFAANLVAALAIANKSLANTVQKKIYASLSGDLQIDILKKIGRVNGVASVAISAMFAFAAFLIIPYVAPSEYLDSRALILIMSATMALQGLYYTSGHILEFHKMNTEKLMIVLCSGLATILVAYFLKNKVGYLSYSYASLVGYAILAYGASKLAWSRLAKLKLMA